MDVAELASKVGELAVKISQLPHGEQCEANNLMNSAPCDCGLKNVQTLSTEVFQAVIGRFDD